MKCFILLAFVAFVSFEQTEAAPSQPTYQCSYKDGQVIETGYPTRPMTADEKQQMVEYEKQWDQWGVQFALFMKGQGTMSANPVMPCFCRKPCKF